MQELDIRQTTSRLVTEDNIEFSPAEHRQYIEQLKIDIEHIEAQLTVAKLRLSTGDGAVKPEWMHKTASALRHKREELAKINNGVDRYYDEFTRAIIRLCREEFNQADWREILTEAKLSTNEKMDAPDGIPQVSVQPYIRRSRPDVGSQELGG